MKRIFLALFIIIFGLAFVAVGVLFLKQPKVEYATTEGTIVKIETRIEPSADIDDPDQEVHDVYVDYTVDGKEYTEVYYPAYSAGMEEGDTVEVLYNPDDPTEITSKGSEFIPYIMLGVGAVSVLIGISTAFRRRRAI